MSRIFVVTGSFPVYDRRGRPTGQREFVVSHGIDEDTGRNVILPSEHPAKLGALWDRETNEWVLE
jgi:hypothetical protein